jgi:hypothetical protein
MFLAVLLLVVVGTIAGAAGAAFAYDPPVHVDGVRPGWGWSSTNPNAGPFEWREGWGNSLNPEFLLHALGTHGFIYRVDQTPYPGSIINTANPSAYTHVPFADSVPLGTLQSHTLDIAGVAAYLPGGGLRNGSLDGSWWYHFVYYSEDATTGALTYSEQRDIEIGIDRVPPAAVSGVLVSPDSSVPAASTAVGPGTRATVRWSPKTSLGADYDLLSGTGYFTMYIDGEAKFTGGPADSQQMSPWMYSPISGVPSSVSIEDLAPGRHEFRVSATDHAGNEGPQSAAAVFYADPDAPTISIKAPANSGRYVMVESFVDELGGVEKIDYYVDGQFAMSSTAATVQTYDSWRGYYDFPSLDMARFRAGTHSVKAVVTDMVGRTATSNTVSVKVWDVTVPTVSRPSCGPNPFYPIKLDGYRDSTKITFRLSERAYVKLQIFDYSGEMVRELGSWRRAGKNTIVWSGQQKDKSKVAGRYTFRIVANDGKYNISTSSTGIVQLRSFYLKRISRSRVRAVYS